MKKLFLLMTFIVSLLHAERFRNLPKDSLLKSKCEEAAEVWFEKGDVKKACAQLDNRVERIRCGQEVIRFDDIPAEWDRINRSLYKFAGQKEANIRFFIEKAAREVEQIKNFNIIFADEKKSTTYEEFADLKEYERQLFEAYDSRRVSGK
jgi:hypothetical protein